MYRSIDELSTLAPFDCITLWHVLEHFADPLARTEGSATTARHRRSSRAGGARRRWNTGQGVGPLLVSSRCSASLRPLQPVFTRTAFAKGWIRGRTNLARRIRVRFVGLVAKAGLNRWCSPPNAFFELLTGHAAVSQADQNRARVLVSRHFVLRTWLVADVVGHGCRRGRNLDRGGASDF